MGGARVVKNLDVILSTGYKGPSLPSQTRRDTDFQGPLIYEVFEAPFMDRSDIEIPRLYAQACAASKAKLVNRLQTGGRSTSL